MSSKTTQRSLERMRKLGYECAIVERWNAFAHVRQDLFGFCDILCVRPVDYKRSVRPEIVAVQTTTAAHALERIAKIQAELRAEVWLKAGGKIQVHGWKKGGKRSAAPGRWLCDIYSVTLET